MGRFVSESYAVQKQREEVVGRLLHFSRKLFETKNANFLRKSNRCTYVFTHLPF